MQVGFVFRNKSACALTAAFIFLRGVFASPHPLGLRFARDIYFCCAYLLFVWKKMSLPAKKRGKNRLKIPDEMTTFAGRSMFKNCIKLEKKKKLNEVFVVLSSSKLTSDSCKVWDESVKIPSAKTLLFSFTWR